MKGRPVNSMNTARRSIVIVSLITLMSACSDEPRSQEPSHPMLHCDDSESSFLGGDFDPSVPGYETVEAAKAGVLDSFVEDHGGTVIDIDERTLGLLVDGAVVVVAPIDDAPAGGFWNDTFYLCVAYAPLQVGPPATEPPITS